MANERWSYQVVDVKPAFLGSNREVIQDRLNQLGLQGWELVAVTQTHPLKATQLFLKKAL